MRSISLLRWPAIVELLDLLGTGLERQCGDNDIADTVWIRVAKQVKKVIFRAAESRQRDQHIELSSALGGFAGEPQTEIACGLLAAFEAGAGFVLIAIGGYRDFRCRRPR